MCTWDEKNIIWKRSKIQKNGIAIILDVFCQLNSFCDEPKCKSRTYFSSLRINKSSAKCSNLGHLPAQVWKNKKSYPRQISYPFLKNFFIISAVTYDTFQPKLEKHSYIFSKIPLKQISYTQIVFISCILEKSFLY